MTERIVAVHKGDAGAAGRMRYLTGTEHHRRDPRGVRSLRAYLMFHQLFGQTLVTGDSQFNNNQNLRALVWEEEPIDYGRPVRRDLAALVEEGLLLPVVRSDLDSLMMVRRDHVERKVDSTPSIAYVEFVEGLLQGHRLSYDVKSTAKFFKARALEAFADRTAPGCKVLRPAITREVAQYIEEQDQLFYRSIRGWAGDEVRKGVFTKRDYTIIDHVVGDCYQLNVPLTLGCDTDLALSVSARYLPFDVGIGNMSVPVKSAAAGSADTKFELSDTLVFSSDFLADLPAEVIVAVKGSPRRGIQPVDEYVKVVKQLGRYQAGGKIDLRSFAEDLGEYLRIVDHLGLEAMAGITRRRYLDNRHSERRTVRLRLWESVAVNVFM